VFDGNEDGSEPAGLFRQRFQFRDRLKVTRATGRALRCGPASSCPPGNIDGPNMFTRDVAVIGRGKSILADVL
jgi:hypothetical protein